MVRSVFVGLVLLLVTGVRAQTGFSFRQGRDATVILLDSKPFATFYYSKEWAKPFLHGLRAPSGTVVTRAFPVEKVPGENTEHPWQRGLWFAHGDIAGVDFWRERGWNLTQVQSYPLPLGITLVKGLPRTRAAGTIATLTADIDLVTAGDNKPIGGMLQEFTMQAEAAANIVDARVVVSADRGMPLKFGDTEEGWLGFRFRDEFMQARGATLTNSDGLVTTERIWGKRARWVDYSTTIGDEKLGVAIMDHPRNPKYPSYWHARGYGLCAANPFGESDFLKDKSRDGSLTVPAGSKVEFRYRIVIHEGDLKSARIEQLGAAYAAAK
jgi:hypothetical protein